MREKYFIVSVILIPLLLCIVVGIAFQFFIFMVRPWIYAECESERKVLVAELIDLEKQNDISQVEKQKRQEEIFFKAYQSADNLGDLRLRLY